MEGRWEVVGMGGTGTADFWVCWGRMPTFPSEKLSQFKDTGKGEEITVRPWSGGHAMEGQGPRLERSVGASPPLGVTALHTLAGGKGP